MPMMTNKSHDFTADTVRVNLRTAVNAGAIRRERRNGRDKIIVPSATLPDNIIMNGIKYPADEIEKAYRSLNNTPAPLGHPMIDGEFVSASDPEGINIAWIGAHNENVRRENGRVFLDKVIDVARAEENVGGRAVLEAIEKGDVIHTSTGLYCNIGPAEDDTHEGVALNMVFDHDAILLGEQGAATPEQGVGIFVNAAGNANKIKVYNLSLDEEMDEAIKWHAENLATMADRKNRAPIISEIMEAIFKAMGYKGATNQATGQKESDPMADEKQLEAISNQLGDVKTGLDGLAETIATSVSDAVTNALKPLVDAQTAANEAAEAKRNAELDEFKATIVKANVLSKEAADTLSYDAAKEMAAVAEKPKAAGLSNAFGGKTDDDDPFKGYDLNANIDGPGKKETA